MDGTWINVACSLPCWWRSGPHHQHGNTRITLAEGPEADSRWPVALLPRIAVRQLYMMELIASLIRAHRTANPPTRVPFGNHGMQGAET